MHKTLITLAIVIALIVAMSILWISGGRNLSLFLDRFRTIEIASIPVSAIEYQGTGTGGTLRINDRELSLSMPNANTPSPHIGSTKDGQLGLANAGKIFAFGPLRPSESETLGAQPAAGDQAVMAIRHSIFS